MEIEEIKQLINELVNEKYEQEKRGIALVIVSKFKAQQKQIEDLKAENEAIKKAKDIISLVEVATTKENTKLKERVKQADEVVDMVLKADEEKLDPTKDNNDKLLMDVLCVAGGYKLLKD